MSPGIGEWIVTGQQPHNRAFGVHLRDWRRRRRMSQLDCALETEISQKHLSFIESGRSVPSRDMVIRLTESLEVPLRERNTMLLAAGYAPLYLARGLNDPSLAAARAAIDLILKGLEPYPALAIDRHWTMLAANAAVAPLLAGIHTELLAPPVNVLRLSLHPDGLAPRILNLSEWRAHILQRLKHQINITADPVLVALMKELLALPNAAGDEPDLPDTSEVFVPLRIETPEGPLSLFSATTVFGTPVDVTLSEIAIESFFPADDRTREILRAISPSG